jgi:hypothetical protein
MKAILTAIALSIALPSIAHAQAAPVPEQKQDCCANMKAQGKECCCKDMAKDGHAEHDTKTGDKSAEHKH